MKKQKDLTQIKLAFKKASYLNRKSVMALIQLLDLHGDKPLIYYLNHIDEQQCVLSIYLKDFKKFGWVTSIKEGRKKFYTLTPDFYNFVEKINDFNRNYPRVAATRTHSTV